MAEISLESIRKAIEPFALEIADLYRKRLKDENINASGELSNFQTTVEIEGASIIIYFNLKKYWRIIERGRPPGRTPPPIKPIMDWVNIKIKHPIPSAKNVAFAISKSIGKHGTKGKYPLSNALKSKEMTNILDEIRSTIKNEINIEIQNVITESLKPLSKR
jgi:hypothetical protein